MRAKLLLGFTALLFCAQAQQRVDWTDKFPSEKGVVLRSEFVGYDTRPEAEAMNRDKAKYTQQLDMFSATRDGIDQYRAVVDIPFSWADRKIFLCVEGLSDIEVEVDDKPAGYAMARNTPAQFDLTEYLKEGMHNIAIKIVGNGPGSKIDGKAGVKLNSAYLYAQPKLYIENYNVVATPDSTRTMGFLKLDVALANAFNATETVEVGYDIYSPEGKLLRYDLRPVTLDPQGRDTFRFRQDIYGGVMMRLWSDKSPKLFRMIVYLKRDNRIIEYIPFVVGFMDKEFDGENFYINKSKIDIRSVVYNATNVVQTKEKLLKFKKEGINTITPDYGQPHWFYDLCDQLGLYVIDAVGINAGELNNNPRYVDHYIYKVRAAYERNRNYTSIIGWSLGQTPNGYNMYKAYQCAKSYGDSRPILYKGANGEWNADQVIVTKSIK